MNAKISKKITACALAILLLSTIFVLILLFAGTLSNAVKESSDMSEGIAIGCTGAVLVIVFLFTVIVKVLSIIFGISSLFVKRKLSAVLVLGVLTCVLAIISLICSIYCLAIFQPIQNGSDSASLMNAGLISAVVSDLFWLVSIILSTIAISKMVKTLTESEAKEIKL